MPEAGLAEFRRHELVWLTPAAWREALARYSGLRDVSVLGNWAARGWPTIVRRRHSGEPGDEVPVGVPLPPSLGKARIALTVPADGIRERKRLLPLEMARTAAPAAWRESVLRVLALADASRLGVGVFGSLLWQHMTGLDYLGPASDLDLLWPLSAGGVPAPLLEGLAALDARGPRIDGEIIFADGTAVNWRELWMATDRPDQEVLLKSSDGVTLVRAQVLLAGGPTA